MRIEREAKLVRLASGNHLCIVNVLLAVYFLFMWSILSDYLNSVDMILIKNVHLEKAIITMAMPATAFFTSAMQEILPP